MANQRAKEEALLFRRKGLSISEIAVALQISKSTVANWCRDIVLNDSQITALVEKQRKSGNVGRQRAISINRALRLENISKMAQLGVKDVGKLSSRDIYILGLALYWGEGYKSGNDECGLTNSDPAIIMSFIQWLDQVFYVKKADLIVRVSVNSTHKHRIEVIEKYWSQQTHIPLSQFTKSSLIQARVKKIYANSDSHFGTLRVKVRRGTSLRRRIMGSLDSVRKQVVK